MDNMDAKEQPPSALQLRSLNEFDFEQTQDDENMKGIGNEDDDEYQDKDLRKPCVPSPSPDPAVFHTVWYSWFTPRWWTDVPSVELPHFLQKPEASRRPRVGLATLTHLLSALLASVRVLGCQLSARDRGQCQTDKKVLTQGNDVNDADGAGDHVNPQQGSILGKRKNSFIHDECDLSKTVKKRQSSRTVEGVQLLPGTLGKKKSESVEKEQLYEGVEKEQLSGTVEKQQLSGAVKKMRMFRVLNNSDMKKVSVTGVHSLADRMTKMLEDIEKKTNDSHREFTNKAPILDLNDGLKNEILDSHLGFTKKHRRLGGLSDHLENEILECCLKLTEGKEIFQSFFNRVQPARVFGVVFPVSGQRPWQGSGSGGGPDPQTRLTPVDLSSVDTQWPPDSMYGTPWTTFRQELYRLGTFLNVPQDFPVSPLRLAQAGFLRLANESIMCYFCGLVRNDWRSQESPMDVHRQLCPDCPMVTGLDCQNVAVTEVQPLDRLAQVMQSWSLSGGELAQPLWTQEDSQSRGADLTEDGAKALPEANTQASGTSEGATGTTEGATGTTREATGIRPAQVPSQTPAAPRPPPPVRLGLMGGAPGSTNPSLGRSPVLHGTAQPDLDPNARSGGQGQWGGGQQVVTLQQLGIVTGNARRPDMSTVHSRLDTFRGGWADTRHQFLPTAEQLAEAGFYYAGYSDCGRCFSCGGGLKNWEPTDDPWVVHARWFPACAYVRASQGQVFIDVISELKNLTPDRTISRSEVRQHMATRQFIRGGTQEPFSDPAVESAVMAGFSQQVAEAAARRMISEGQSLTAARLMDYLEADGDQSTASASASASSWAEANESNDDSTSRRDVEKEVESLQAENTELRQHGQCKICLDKDASIIFLPCGHLATCAVCSPALHSCPVCRLTIKGRVRAFRTIP